MVSAYQLLHSAPLRTRFLLVRSYIPSRFRSITFGAPSNAAVLGSAEVPNARTLPPASARGRSKCAASSGARNRYTRFRDDREFEPFWLSSLKDAARGMRSLILFLLEQPSQLKYIEWPTFQNTLKTATLTLVLVAVLIVALSSIDAALSFMLAMFLRKCG